MGKPSAEQKKGKYKYFYGKSYNEVKQIRYDFDVSAQNESTVTAKLLENPLLSSVFVLWLSETRVMVKRSTYLNYDDIIRLHLLPMFSDIDISNLSTLT